MEKKSEYSLEYQRIYVRDRITRNKLLLKRHENGDDPMTAARAGNVKERMEQEVILQAYVGGRWEKGHAMPLARVDQGRERVNDLLTHRCLTTRPESEPLETLKIGVELRRDAALEGGLAGSSHRVPALSRRLPSSC